MAPRAAILCLTGGLLMLAHGVAGAATLDVEVIGADGHPLADAVVTIEGPAKPSAPIAFPWPYVMSQRHISFQPHVLIVPVGTTVAFPNFDLVRHHVYSFSKPKKFELKLYGQDQTRSVLFDKPGVVALGCNIHDSMSGFIVVVDTPYAAKTDADGHARLDVPAGAATLTLWAASIRAPGSMTTQPVSVPAAGLAKTLTIAP